MFTNNDNKIIITVEIGVKCSQTQYLLLSQIHSDTANTLEFDHLHCTIFIIYATFRFVNYLQW